MASYMKSSKRRAEPAQGGAGAGGGAEGSAGRDPHALWTGSAILSVLLFRVCINASTKHDEGSFRQAPRFTMSVVPGEAVGDRMEV